MTAEAIHSINVDTIRKIISSSTGRSFAGFGKENGDLKEIPWEDKMAARLLTKAKKKKVSFRYSKNEDKITYTWGDKELELTKHLEVGEHGKTNFYMSAEKKQWDDAAPWFGKEFDKIPVELHTMEKTESGAIIERVVYSAA